MDSKSKLFDDIFRLQNTFPEDIDPEDPIDGFRSGLTEGATEVEDVGSTSLKKRSAIILDDPKYRGKKTLRKDLYSDDDESQASDGSKIDDDDDDDYAEGEETMDGIESDLDDDEEESEGSHSGEDGEDDDDGFEEDGENDSTDKGEKKDATIMAPSDANEKEKGKAVSYQLGLWDDLIKCRISLQKMFSLCNKLPTPDVWDRFVSFPSFKKELPEAQSSSSQILNALLELQEVIQLQVCKNAKERKGEGDDEEITSESEIEDEDDDIKTTKQESADDAGIGDEMDDDEAEEENEDDEGDKMDYDQDEETKEEKVTENKKRKLDSKEVEKTLSKRHKSFQSFRNKTLTIWDEKTRLAHTAVKSKNFAAFDISVMKQIQQVLANKSRLVKRIHQNRSSVRVLGHAESDNNEMPQEEVVEDDEDEIEVRQRAIKPELGVNPEIIDDQDFYQMLLRDFIVLKQNEETDPVMANKHWLEIQNLRKKQKRKVDTRASKGRKIRYHVKEKLKNFMAPYDKSTWSDEQKDDLFRSLFGGRQPKADNEPVPEEIEAPTINIGL